MLVKLGNFSNDFSLSFINDDFNPQVLRSLNHYAKEVDVSVHKIVKGDRAMYAGTSDNPPQRLDDHETALKPIFEVSKPFGEHEKLAWVDFVKLLCKVCMRGWPPIMRGLIEYPAQIVLYQAGIPMAKDRHSLGFPTDAKACRGASFDGATMFFYIQSFDPVTTRAIKKYPNIASSYKLGIPGMI